MNESSIKNMDQLTAEQVAAFLRKHPDFFTQHSDLLTDLELPHNSGSAVSLVERQVAILRERNIEMRQRLSHLLDSARENDRLFDKTKRLALALLEGNDLGDMVDALYYSFDREFKIHYTRLILFGNHDSIPASAARVVTMREARQHIAKRLSATNAISGGLDVYENQFLFDSDACNIGSAAVAVLSRSTPLGVLAIGNQDPAYYRSGMGTLFLSFIAELLNRLLPQHLA